MWLQIPFNFLAGIEGIPAFDEHLSKLSKAFTTVSFLSEVNSYTIALRTCTQAVFALDHNTRR